MTEDIDDFDISFINILWIFLQPVDNNLGTE